MKFTFDGSYTELLELFSKRNDIMALRDEFRAAIAMLRDENSQTQQRVDTVLAVLTSTRDDLAALRDQLGDAIEQQDLDALTEIKTGMDSIQAAIDAAVAPSPGGDTVPGGEPA